MLTTVLGRFAPLVGRGLAQILQEDRGIRIVAADLDGVELERAIAERAPRVVILDELNIADPSILERIQDVQPTVGLIVLAHEPTVTYGTRLFTLGANCVAKDVSAANIRTAVRIAAEGRRVFADVDGHLLERASPAADAALTPREEEVLEYLSRGRSHAEIAHAMRLGVETVRTHTAHIRRKLGVRRSRDLIGVPLLARQGRRRLPGAR